MIRYLFILTLTLLPSFLKGQDGNFKFGEINFDDMKQSSADTSAAAVILQEFGHASVHYSDQVYQLFHYHVRIKVLKSEGLSEGTIVLQLYRDNNNQMAERLRDVRAASFNVEDGLIRESSIGNKEVLSEQVDKNWTTKKIIIPNVRVGSVIEYEYEMERPWFQQSFKSWQFQRDIPKLRSEYWATIPANWRYNIALKGPLPLSKNESEAMREAFSIGGNHADCARYKWAMENIPAFYEEEYMTSKRNFLSAIEFELLQIEYFDGRKDRVTKEWRDVEQELKAWEKFGVQLRRGKDVVDSRIEQVIAGEPNPLEKAKKIFDFIRQWYVWNEADGYYTETGIRKAFEARRGNVGDINLSLIAALRYGGLNVEPMILSTRSNGLPTELFPVLTDFNYVVAKLNVEDKVFLLDATDDMLPFGLLPERCLNGKGRVLGEKQSYWYEIKPMDRSRVISYVNLKLDAEGVMIGTVRNTYFGYKAADKRRSILSKGSTDEYVEFIKSEDAFEITNYAYTNLDDLSKPLVETFDVELLQQDIANSKTFYFNPFLVERWRKNPFHLATRLYPVDFGYPIEETTVFILEVPENLKVVDLPAATALGLPGNGGKLLFNATATGTKVQVNFSLSIAKAVYLSDDYPYLKELFNQIVRVQTTDLVFQRLGG